MRSASADDKVDLALFAGVALIWSSSFLFIKIAVADIPPWTIAASRIGIAAMLLYAVLRLRGGRLPTEPVEWGKFAFIGLFGNALPFFLIGYGEQTVDSGLAAILMGIMPVATVLLAHLLVPEEPFNAGMAVGIAMGFGGIVVLVGPQALAGLDTTTLAQLAVLCGALCYSLTTVFVRRTTSLAGPVMAAGSQVAAAAMVIPVALLVDHPWELQPGAAAVASVIVLGIFPTAAATLMYFRLIRNIGAGRMSQVNYLIPVLGAAWGVLLLGERLRATTWIALGLVLAGIAVVNRARRGRS